MLAGGLEVRLPDVHGHLVVALPEQLPRGEPHGVDGLRLGRQAARAVVGERMLALGLDDRAPRA